MLLDAWCLPLSFPYHTGTPLLEFAFRNFLSSYCAAPSFWAARWDWYNILIVCRCLEGEWQIAIHDIFMIFPCFPEATAPTPILFLIYFPRDVFVDTNLDVCSLVFWNVFVPHLYFLVLLTDDQTLHTFSLSSNLANFLYEVLQVRIIGKLSLELLMRTVMWELRITRVFSVYCDF